MFADCFLVVKAGDSIVLSQRHEDGTERRLTLNRNGFIACEVTGEKAPRSFASISKADADRILAQFAQFTR